MDNGTHFGQGLVATLMVLVLVMPTVGATDELTWTEASGNNDSIQAFARCRDRVDAAIEHPGDLEGAVDAARTCIDELSEVLCVWGSSWVQVNSSTVSRAVFTQVNSLGQLEAASAVVDTTLGEMASPWAREITVDFSSNCAGRSLLGGSPVWNSQELDGRAFIDWLKDRNPGD